MNVRIALLATVLAIPGMGASANAGAVFRTTVENFAEGNQFFDAQESYVTVTKVDGDRMRTDTQAMDGTLTTTMLFLGDRDEMYVIDHDEKSYLVLDREQIESLAEQMNDAMQQMQEALAQVPAEQRAMMERMMKDKMPGGDHEPPSPPVVTGLGESASVNGVACQWKQVTRDGVLEEKACVADANEIPGGAEMVAIANEMRDFVQALTQVAQSVSNIPMLGGGTVGTVGAGLNADLGGYPLISENYDGEGELMRRSTFESADQVAIPADDFSPPSGYERKQLEGLGR